MLRRTESGPRWVGCASGRTPSGGRPSPPSPALPQMGQIPAVTAPRPNSRQILESWAQIWCPSLQDRAWGGAGSPGHVVDHVAVALGRASTQPNWVRRLRAADSPPCGPTPSPRANTHAQPIMDSSRISHAANRGQGPTAQQLAASGPNAQQLAASARAQRRTAHARPAAHGQRPPTTHHESWSAGATSTATAVRNGSEVERRPQVPEIVRAAVAHGGQTGGACSADGPVGVVDEQRLGG